MSLTKRLRLLWAAISQHWHQHVCDCGATQWVEGPLTWDDSSVCIPCETKAFEDWQRKREARLNSKKEIA